MSAPFERLHPAVRHHVVNSLGWRSLRPLQEQAIAPVLEGGHVLLGAPTAGGKTEAALFPLFSRMVEERWPGLSVLYVCPLRALLNNLLPRVQGYADLLGRRAAVWHGDVGEADRKAVLRDPPDVLLTTPESLEAMFMSRRVRERELFGGVRAVVVDEILAFAGDDRGWHLLAMLARLDELTGRELQRIGLTATVGNPDALVDWLATGGKGPRRTVMTAGEPGAATPELTVDWVAGVENAARVIAALHRGEKRLVFADSRARVEELATALRSAGVTTFVSHSSVGREDRRAAEAAFTESQNCVIVATSTLELGIDIGDLERVVQVGAPRTVASVLQRMGRTGRRADTSRNCLFLATSDMELLQALALIRLVGEDWVEPLIAPALPIHLLAQQLLARVLCAGAVGASTWPGALEPVREQTGLSGGVPRELLEWMLERGLLVQDSGLVSMGPEGEREYGRRNFMDVTSLFLTEPLLNVRWGQREVGTVDPSSLLVRDEGQRPVILLGGRAWGVGEADYDRRIVWVEPVDEPGRSTWSSSGGTLSMQVCHAIRDTLVDPGPVAGALTRRGAAKLAELRAEFAWVREGRTSLIRDERRERTRWWTFAGGRANAAVSAGLHAAGLRTTSADDLSIGLERATHQSLQAAAGELDSASLAPEVQPRRRDAVKFASCCPTHALETMIRARDRDEEGTRMVLDEPIESASEDGKG